MTPRRSARLTAFSLVEAMVAASILAIVLTTAVGAMSMGFRFIAERRLRTTAEAVCQSHMEMLLAIDRGRALLPGDCNVVTYDRDVVDADTSAVFRASCRLIRNQPPTPTQKFDRLMVDVAVAFEGRDLKTTYATYVVHQ